jgi:HEPN domain-containing protein
MKGKPDLIRGWLRKAASGLVAMKASAQAGSLDAACFHAQQAAEKYLKAYLNEQDQAIPHTHNLYKLLALCSEFEPAFQQLIDAADLLTPFAVEARNDTEFWPSTEILAQAESEANHIAQFVAARIQSSRLPAIGVHEAWKAARHRFDWRVNLQHFKGAHLYQPEFFNRAIEPGNIVEFENAVRAELVAGGRVERGAEVVFWKNYGNHLARNKITQRFLAAMSGPEAWSQLVSSIRSLAATPTWGSFNALKKLCGGFATPLTFLSFYDPQRFPMVDRKIGVWWSGKFSDKAQFKWGGEVIASVKQSWEAYVAWTEFCRRQAAKLSTLGETPWRARDVEMAVWSDTNAQLPLDE